MTKQANAFSTKAITYSGIGIAIAIIMNQISIYKMPQGGSVTLISMFFITVLGYWFGLKVGLIAGVAMGLMNMVLGGVMITAAGAILDYPLAFGMLGLSALFRKQKNGLMTGYLFAGIMRYLVHVVSGILIWYMYTPEGWNYILWSFVYNTFMFPEMVATLVILSIPSFRRVIDKLA